MSLLAYQQLVRLPDQRERQNGGVGTQLNKIKPVFNTGLFLSCKISSFANNGRLSCSVNKRVPYPY